MNELKNKILGDAAYLTTLRRKLHQHPELGMQEFETAAIIEKELSHWGIWHKRIGATGVLGIIKGAREGGRRIALRGDIDALPIHGQNDIEYHSKTDGVMHACGHDAHTACLIGAGKALQERRELFGGEIRLIFQPGEEIGKGAMDFIQSGALQGVERVFGLHTAVDLHVGTIGLTPKLNNAAVDHFSIQVYGKSAHVSTPQLGADALYISCQTVIAIQALVTRLTSPVEPVLIGIGKLHTGTAYNALAEFAQIEGTTRTISQQTRMNIRQKITQVAVETANFYGGRAEIIWTDICSALMNDSTVVQEVQAAVKQIDEKITIIGNRELSLGGDNFSEFLQEIPGAYAYLGTANPAKPETLEPAHNGKFNIDEAALPIGAALYAQYALWWLLQGGVT
ncbi:MAG: M20 family metallopeptidase [Anaerotignum sp.]|nr:M20 family metallopeptidase [Anaerotignum sp.]